MTCGGVGHAFAVTVGHKCRECGNYYQTAEQRDRHAAKRHGKKGGHKKRAAGGDGGADLAAQVEAEAARAMRDLEVKLQHQRELAAVEAAAKAREIERLEKEAERLRAEAGKRPEGAAPAANVDSEVMRRFQEEMDKRRRDELDREADLKRQLREVRAAGQTAARCHAVEGRGARARAPSHLCSRSCLDLAASRGNGAAAQGHRRGQRRCWC